MREIHAIQRTSVASRPPGHLRACALALLLGAAACGGNDEDSEAAGDGAARPAMAAGADAQQITLITGDRVVVTPTSGAPVVDVFPGPGRDRIGFVKQLRRDRVVVIPEDVAPAVASGAIDRALFDVTRLLAEGHGDAERGDLPLIVIGRSQALGATISAGRSAALVAGPTIRSIDAIAVRQRKASPGGSGILAALAAPGGGLAPGHQIWLDARLRPLLDHSVAQIGAPAAHAAGYTGAGVTVAVLDTGIDAAHPDLAGKVLEAQTFMDDGLGDSDVVGHGTHVASIIAGSGAASGGLYRGVAPGAQLLSGRVCGVYFCDMSAILAAMEWAVVTKGARLVNLSLGGPDEPELDPLEQAIEELSAQYGALFVVAAGNSGGGAGTIESPASADAALAVGAVDRDDGLAEFSSRGPRTGDHGIKPDLTAPGVEIVAAKASAVEDGYGTPVGTAYLALSGTSMATPHVTAAAALLLQQHPAWSGARLKAALMSSASPSPALSVFEQGAGRLDAARAVAQPLFGEPASLSFGIARWPHGDDPLLARTVTYHNAGPAPITLALAVAMTGPGQEPAAGMAAVDAGTLEVPAGGAASAVVTVDTRGVRPDGLYAGKLVATAPGVRIVTPIAIDREVESYDLTLHAIDGDGAPMDMVVDLVPLREDPAYQELELRGARTVRLPRGDYHVDAIRFSPGPLFFAAPRVELTHDVAITFDAALARPLAPRIPGVDLRLRSNNIQIWQRIPSFETSLHTPNQLRTAHLGSAAPARDVVTVTTGSWVAGTPTGEDDRSVYLLGHHARGRALTGWAQTIDPRDLAVVHASHGTSIEGKRYRKSAAGLLEVETGMMLADPGTIDYPGPFTRTEHYYGIGFTWSPYLGEYRDDLPGIFGNLIAAPRRYHGGHHYAEAWNRAPFGPSFAPFFQLPRVMRTADTMTLDPSMFSDAADRYAWWPEGVEYDRTALFRDGELLSERINEPSVPYEVPPEPASYRFEREQVRSPPLSELSTRVTAAWTFRSHHAGGPDPGALPLLGMRFAPELDDRGRAARALPLWVPIHLERPGGAPVPPVARLSLEASFDDGATWSSVWVIRLVGRWYGLMVHPQGARYVSLRGEATDHTGSSVEQTIVRAYELK